MKPRDVEALITVLIGLQIAAILTLVAATFALFSYVCLYVFRLPLSPLYLAVLAYALVSIAGAVWLLVQLRRRA